MSERTGEALLHYEHTILAPNYQIVQFILAKRRFWYKNYCILRFKRDLLQPSMSSI